MSHLWVRQYWNDPYFTWTPSDYGDVTEIQLPAQLIWTPDLVMYNNADVETADEFGNVLVKIKHTGEVTYLYPIVHKTTCGLDIFHFPFDQQDCYMRIGSWAFDANQLDLQLKDDNPADHSTFLYNSEWGLVKFTAARIVENFDCCPDAPFVSISFSLTIRRRWIMYFFYLLMPNLLINITAVAQFLLPSDSGEKITLSITIYLSMVVYLLIMQEILPNSENIPLIVEYIVTTMVVVSFAQIVNIVVLQFHHNGNHDNYGRLPHWTRKVFLHGLSKLLCLHRFIVPDEIHEAKFSVHISNLSLIPENDSKAMDYESNEGSEHEIKCESPKPCIEKESEKGQNENPNCLHVAEVVQSVKSNKISPATETKVPVGVRKGNSLLHSTPMSSHERKSSIDIIGDPKRSVHLVHKEDLGKNRDLLLFKLLKIAEEYKEEKVANAAEEELRCEWQQLAMVIDRFMFFVYFFVTFILWIVLFATIPSYDEEIIL